MYSTPQHPFIKMAIEELYDNGNKHFIKPDGTDCGFVIDLALMRKLKEHYGIKYIDKKQTLADNTIIYDSTVFATRKSRTKDSVLIHWFDQSWKKQNTIKFKLKRFIKRYLFFIYRRI